MVEILSLVMIHYWDRDNLKTSKMKTVFIKIRSPKTERRFDKKIFWCNLDQSSADMDVLVREFSYQLHVYEFVFSLHGFK